MEIKFEQKGTVFEIALIGSFTASYEPKDLFEALETATGIENVRVDLLRLTQIGSAFINLLAQIRRRLPGLPGTIGLVNAPPDTPLLLRTTGMDGMFPVLSQVPPAS